MFTKGMNHHNWAGDKVGYRGIHHWINKEMGKANQCSNDATHMSDKYHWANISGKYKRDLNDWKQLCPKCHMQFDNRQFLGKNILRRGFCSHGHKLTLDRLYLKRGQKNGANYRAIECKVCRREQQIKFKRKVWAV